MRERLREAGRESRRCHAGRRAGAAGWSRALGAAALVAAMLAAGGGGARAQVSYQYPPPTNLIVSDIYLAGGIGQSAVPDNLRIQWACGATNPTFEVQRKYVPTGAITEVANGISTTYCVDNFSWNVGQQYVYSVRTISADHDPSQTWIPSNWTTCNVVPQSATASRDQAVDSRYDLRYGNPTYLDHNFGTTTYRGGMFAGFANDPARVGRSFIQFTFPVLGQGTGVWTASVNALWTRNALAGSSSSATVGCQAIANNSWNPSTLVWDNAPSVTPGSATQTVTVTDPGNGSGWNQWQHWSLANDITNALVTSQPLSVALAATNESAVGWAYFAKKEYSGLYAPCVLYATKAPLGPDTVTLNPTTIGTGQSSTGTVILNGLAAAGGQVVYLSSNSVYVSVPTSITIPVGSSTGAFIASAYSTPSGNVTVTITASCNGSPSMPSATLTRTP